MPYIKKKMALYIKKPIAIEAFRYEGDLKACGKYCVPDWAVEAYEEGVMYYKQVTEIQSIRLNRLLIC